MDALREQLEDEKTESAVANKKTLNVSVFNIHRKSNSLKWLCTRSTRNSE